MARPVKVKSASEHLLVLTRMLSQVDADESMEGKRKLRVKRKLGELMAELQAEVMSA